MEGQIFGWKIATAARKESSEEVMRQIKELDFYNMDFFKEDINSLSILNTNVFMTDEELGKLANRILREVFLVYANVTPNKVGKHFFPQQMKILKDLLVEYRTEQVVGAIIYWSCINPPLKGLSSLAYLKYKRKGKSNMMIALDYFKQEYIKENSASKTKLEEILMQEQERKQREKEDMERVANMSDEEFIQNLFNGILGGI